VVLLIKFTVRNAELGLFVWLCLAVIAVGKNRICKVMFMVRHVNEINDMENKST
jgi:hypothetical protein